MAISQRRRSEISDEAVARIARRFEQLWGSTMEHLAPFYRYEAPSASFTFVGGRKAMIQTNTSFAAFDRGSEVLLVDGAGRKLIVNKAGLELHGFVPHAFKTDSPAEERATRKAADEALEEIRKTLEALKG